MIMVLIGNLGASTGVLPEGALAFLFVGKRKEYFWLILELLLSFVWDLCMEF